MLRRWMPERAAASCSPQINASAQHADFPADGCLRLLSFNIQVGINTERYRHYLTRSWQHLLPNAGRAMNLQRIAGLLADFDVVALQEVDGGSLRSGFVNQVERLAQLGHFPFWYQQLNRNYGRFAQHSNGLLSRIPPVLLEDHPLPGPSGRGAILMQLGDGEHALAVVSVHLALGGRARARQLAYIRELIGGYRHIVLMGDMNTQVADLLLYSPLRDLGLMAPQLEPTFPSWRPQRCLDHILLSSELTLERVRPLMQSISDHLPVAVDIRLPSAITAARSALVVS